MMLEKNMKHPNFILGLISYILLLVGVVVLAANPVVGRPLIVSAFIAGAIHWALTMVTIVRDKNLDDDRSRHFWFAITLMVPPIGGMLYYMVDGRRFSL